MCYSRQSYLLKKEKGSHVCTTAHSFSWFAKKDVCNYAPHTTFLEYRLSCKRRKYTCDYFALPRETELYGPKMLSLEDCAFFDNGVEAMFVPGICLDRLLGQLIISRNLISPANSPAKWLCDTIFWDNRMEGQKLKDLMPITFSSSRAQPEVVHFLISNESPYFSSCKSKISASNSLYFWRYDKKCEVNWYTKKISYVYS